VEDDAEPGQAGEAGRYRAGLRGTGIGHADAVDQSVHQPEHVAEHEPVDLAVALGGSARPDSALAGPTTLTIKVAPSRRTRTTPGDHRA
jgi:hypothetical protein